MNLGDMTVAEFAALAERVSRGDMGEKPAVVLQRQPVPPVAKHLRGLSPAECRARLRGEKNKYISGITRGRWSDAESLEWYAMDLEIRVCLLILAGVGDDFGELSALADRAWLEMPPPERDAIKQKVRAMRGAMAKVCSLAGW